ncbi:unnamed protein product [Prorocentrum cordatum]|uniref:Uncharacterized protein n=1 Tax=Prorocentrum cordatum TaxID=2364126 RepID=A0ABN9UV57_9DINO|nr:unnamed protein product [Polarella glacialis]
MSCEAWGLAHALWVHGCCALGGAVSAGACARLAAAVDEQLAEVQRGLAAADEDARAELEQRHLGNISPPGRSMPRAPLRPEARPGRARARGAGRAGADGGAAAGTACVGGGALGGARLHSSTLALSSSRCTRTPGRTFAQSAPR